jgi:glycerol-3-phosphate O-acyltransferase
MNHRSNADYVLVAFVLARAVSISYAVGLLDYIARTLLEPDFRRDIWLVPVALNYDRVLEDRTLVAEWLDTLRPGKLRQLAAASRYLARNLSPLTRRKPERYGRAAVCFGTPPPTP